MGLCPLLWVELLIQSGVLVEIFLLSKESTEFPTVNGLISQPGSTLPKTGCFFVAEASYQKSYGVNILDV